MGKARRKERDASSEDKMYLQEEFLQCLGVEMELCELVNLPNGVLLQEWVASHTLAFFEHINLIYGTISEFCTMSGCSEMCGPCNKLYLWTDERGKRSKVAAPQYIDYVMTYLQKTLNDESIFPTKQDKDFPVSFDVCARKIYRLLFHVIAHIYHMHFNEIVILDLHKHLNCIFAHLILFNQQFNLIETKELETLNDLSIALKLVPDNQPSSQIASVGEPMQTSSTPEPPTSLPTSLNLSSSIEQYLDTNAKDSDSSANHTMELHTSSSFNHSNNALDSGQRKKHSRQHSYTASQTISSPTNYIKRFISSFNSSTNSSSNQNQSSAINEEIIDSQSQSSTIGSAINAQSKSNANAISSFSLMRNDDQNDLLNSDQENQHDLNKNSSSTTSSSNQKIMLINNHLNKRSSQDEDTRRQQTDVFGALSNSSSKTHKYQHSTPIFLSSSFLPNRINSSCSTTSKQSDQTNLVAGDSRFGETDSVQFNTQSVIKENTKLLNSDQFDGDQYCSRRTTSAIHLTQSNASSHSSTTGAPSIFSSSSSNAHHHNLMCDLDEELHLDCSLDDQTTTMSCGLAQDLNSYLEM